MNHIHLAPQRLDVHLNFGGGVGISINLRRLWKAVFREKVAGVPLL
jgi:hypothetical protein